MSGHRRGREVLTVVEPGGKSQGGAKPRSAIGHTADSRSASLEERVTSPDDAIEALRSIRDEFAAFCASRGRASEADTRAKVIDRVLREVLGWPDVDLSREDRVADGWLDYSLRVRTRPFVTVEAKREGITFELPGETKPKTLKLSGTLLTDLHVRDAVLQVHSYCVEIGSRYAIATNGYAWVVFRAIREDLPWREGSARVFYSIDSILENFTSYWNLLSYEALINGSLDTEFGSPIRVQRRLDRVIASLFNADLPLQRNRLHAQLFPIIRHVFEDIGDQAQIEVLQDCYVHSASLRIVAEDLDIVITDAIPKFPEDQGAEELSSGPDHAGRFERALTHVLTEHTKGHLFLLLGGIGCGKTTFLKRYQRTVGKDLLTSTSFYFHIDFLTPPLDPTELEVFVWRGVLEQIRERYQSPYLESRSNLKRAFAKDIEALRQTIPRASTDPTAIDAALTPYLQKWQQNLSEYVPRLLTLVASRYGRSVVVFIDNVDQLSPAYQAQVFLLAQRVTRSLGSITVVSLREESYYSATVQRTFTAYSNRKFHIASPRFRTLIASRIRYATGWLESEGAQTSLVGFAPGSRIAIDKAAIGEFLRIVEFSIFEQNHNIARLIEALCFGNMRLALEMFATFLGSGATDVDKMLRIYRREGAYFVAFHEFLKSIMLGDRRYYKEAQSPIMNVFDCGPEKNSSHFTTLRVLKYLRTLRGQATPEGQGYCDLAGVVGAMEDVFDNREDVIRCLNRLVVRQLVETDTRSTESIRNAAAVRVTSAGLYYLTYLARSFAYLDLVLQDTPLNAPEVEQELRRSVHEVDNLGGRDEDKLRSLEVRFSRVGTFLDYLGKDEEEEQVRLGLNGLENVLTEPIVPPVVAQFKKEKMWIERRVRENRERVAEDIVQAPPDETLEDPDSASEAGEEGSGQAG